ncbi:MAG: hypothetical protein WD382_04135 [Halofilum sp. (in: g-proteobacteria)]
MASELTKIEEALRKLQAQSGDSSEVSTAVSTDTRPATRRGSADIGRMTTPETWSPAQLEKRGLLDFFGPERQAANAFRQLRTSLVHRAAESNFVLAVTGVRQGSGTSFVARNLAAAFALDPTKTSVLVDCELGDRTNSRMTPGSGGVRGLTDYLRHEEMRVDQLIQPTGVSRLRVIPAGTLTQGAGELYTSPRMQELLGQLRGRYPDRFTILDVPPVIDNADGRILSELCDYTLLVVPYAGASEARVGRAMDIVGADRLIGTVVNNDPGGQS